MHSNDDASTGAQALARAAPLDADGWRALVEWLPEPVVVVDRQRVILANEAAGQLLGCAALALVGRAAAEFLPGDQVGASAGDGPPRRTERSILHADGSERRVEVTAAPWPGSAPPPCRLLLLHDITQRRRREDALYRAQTRLRRLTAHRDARQRAERARVARHLHDALQQPLAAILFELAALGEAASAGTTPVAAAIARLRAITAAALSSTRQVTSDLQPLLVEELGVLDAVDALVRDFERRTGIPGEVRERGMASATPEQTSPAMGALLLEALQEALDNVRRHARAGSVRVVVWRDRAGTLHLRLRDDGVGLQGVALDALSFGLHGLVERVRSVGGDFSIRPARPRGTRMDLRLPARPRAPAAGALDDALPPEHSYDVLLRFLYRTPIGLIEADANGGIRLMNPAAARMLMPLADAQGLANLFHLLREDLPRLRTWAARVDDAPCLLCDAVPLATSGTARGPRSQVEVSVHLLEDGQLLATLLQRAAGDEGAPEGPASERPPA